MNKSLNLAMQDDVTAAQLIKVTRRHIKLVLEHGRANTAPEKRRAISKEIESLRAARNAILEQFAERDSLWYRT